MVDVIDHAKAYPFPSPDHSYVFDSGRWYPLQTGDVELGGRTPVLAAGSNQSPEQLSRKYANRPNLGPIPVIRGRLWDFDVVYAAHLAGYGSIPATFQNSPGTKVEVFVAWFTEPQLLRMHETESSYTFDRLLDFHLELDLGFVPNDIFAYSAKGGCYNHKGRCLSLSEIKASDRLFSSATQSEVQTILYERLAPIMEIENFIYENISDAVIRAGRVAAIQTDAIEIGYQREKLILL